MAKKKGDEKSESFKWTDDEAKRRHISHINGVRSDFLRNAAFWPLYK